MDKVNAKTKKSLFRGVLDGFRSTVVGGGGGPGSASLRPDLGIEETLGSEHFQVTKVILIIIVIMHLYIEPVVINNNKV